VHLSKAMDQMMMVNLIVQLEYAFHNLVKSSSVNGATTTESKFFNELLQFYLLTFSIKLPCLGFSFLFACCVI
jgi:hypothetical protein